MVPSPFAVGVDDRDRSDHDSDLGGGSETLAHEPN
jgi:hypothetical protein